MAGFMRKPQIINDPNAAPAAMRADDVDLQAQQGDFIMGYPAMQQSGPRVRSLVEQAMLRAKDKGVKTKGYKKGDKVDILVHNKEMHIPQEIIPYIDGGYTTLKKLNQPSKYQSKGTVTDDIDEQSYYNLSNKELVDKKEIPQEFNEYTDDIKGLTLDQLIAPTKGHDEFLRHKDESLPFVAMYGTYGEQVWGKMKIRLSDMFSNYREKSKRPVNIENLYKEYIETVKNIKNGIENSSHNSTKLESILDIDFLRNSHNATRAHMKLNNLSKIKTGNDLNAKITKKHKSLVFDYPFGTHELFAETNRKVTKPEAISAKFNNTDTVSRSNLMKQYMDELENPNKVYINSAGGTGSINGVNQNLNLPEGYNKLFDYLKGVESYQQYANKEPTKEELYSIGYGHQLTPDELQDFQYGKGVSEPTAANYLSKDILNAEALAATTYDKFLSKFNLQGPKFKSLDDNRKSMLIDMAFNMGSNSKDGFGRDKGKGLAEYKNFMTALANNNYLGMSKEYTRNYTNRLGQSVPLKDRNTQFYDTFIKPQLTTADNSMSMDLSSVINKRVLS